MGASPPLSALGGCAAACPNGARATVSQLLDTSEVLLLRPDGEALRVLDLSGHTLCAQAWSPDGRVLFVASRTALHAFDADEGYNAVALFPLSFIALTVSVAAGLHLGSYVLAVGGGPGLLVLACSREAEEPRGDAEGSRRTPCTLRAVCSFRTPGGPLCCAAFDPSGAWLACATMNGMLVLACHSSLAAPQPAAAGQAGAPDGQAGAGSQQLFARRLDARFGALVSGTRPTCLEWAPRGLRLLIGCWDGSVDILEVSNMQYSEFSPALSRGPCRAAQPAGAELRWRLRSACPSDGPIDASFCAPQLCWLPTGLAFAAAHEHRTPHRALPQPKRASLRVILAPPRQLCGMADTVLARVALDEPLAGITLCCARLASPGPAQPAPAERHNRACKEGTGWQAQPEPHLLLVGLSGAVRALRLPPVALLGLPEVEGTSLCSSATEQVILCADVFGDGGTGESCVGGDKAATGDGGGGDATDGSTDAAGRARASSGGPESAPIRWHLRITPNVFAAPSSAQQSTPRAHAQRQGQGPSHESAALLPSPPLPSGQVEECHALAPILHLEWLDIAEAVAHATARPWSRGGTGCAGGGTQGGAAVGAWGVRVSVSQGVLLLARSNALYWLPRGALGGQRARPLGAHRYAADGAGTVRMVVTAERISECCACGSEGRHAALLGSNGVVSLWCLASAQCLRRVSPPDGAGWAARACVSLCALVSAGAAGDAAAGAGERDADDRVCGGGGCGAHGGEGAKQAPGVALRAVLVDYSHFSRESAAADSCGAPCGCSGDSCGSHSGGECGAAGGADRSDPGGWRDGEGLLQLCTIFVSTSGRVRAGRWQEVLAPRNCVPGCMVGLRGKSTIAFCSAEATHDAARRSHGSQSNGHLEHGATEACCVSKTQQAKTVCAGDCAVEGGAVRLILVEVPGDD